MTELVARHRFSDRRHGDFRPNDGPALVAERRQALVDLPWTWVIQRHGSNVVVVTEPGGCAGDEADAIIVTVPGAAIGVRAGDCGLLLLEATDMVAVVHAGWRGLVAGVIERTVEQMRVLGAAEICATLGPSIRPGCYEFGAEDLAVVVERYGPTVVGTTNRGTPALDLPAGVAEACRRLDIELVDSGTCTGCSPDHYSFRFTDKPGNQVLVAWLEHQAGRPG